MTADAPNDLVAGRYRLVRRLETGGTDSVWEAGDEPLSRPAALKMVTPLGGPTESHGVVVGRALQDCRLAAGLDHPNAVTVYDALQHDGEGRRRPL
jgi:hypothetical protein